MRMFVATLANILGAIILIAIVLPWFLIAVGVISVAYIWAAIFYRASARELKVCPSMVLVECVFTHLLWYVVAPGCRPTVVAI